MVSLISRIFQAISCKSARILDWHSVHNSLNSNSGGHSLWGTIEVEKDSWHSVERNDSLHFLSGTSERMTHAYVNMATVMQEREDTQAVLSSRAAEVLFLNSCTNFSLLFLICRLSTSVKRQLLTLFLLMSNILHNLQTFFKTMNLMIDDLILYDTRMYYYYISAKNISTQQLKRYTYPRSSWNMR